MIVSIENRERVRDCIDEIGDRLGELSQMFFRELFILDIGLKRVFSGNAIFLNRKFANMMATFKNLKHMEKIQATLEKMGERHILSYGAQVEHLALARAALMSALKDYFGDRFTPALEKAWDEVFDDVQAIMETAMSGADRRKAKRGLYDESGYDPGLLESIGGEEAVLRVHQRFYENMFDHPWLGRFFGGKNKATLVRKQTEFMVAAFGGPNNYKGDTPAFVHMHMLITDEQADLRESILRQAILDEGIEAALADRWLKMDQSFRASIVKKSANECVMKCKGQAPLVVNKPKGYS